MRQIVARTARNKASRSKIKTLARQVQRAKSSKATDAADVAKKRTIEYISYLDKAVKSGVIHRNKAARHKSRLAKIVMN